MSDRMIELIRRAVDEEESAALRELYEIITPSIRLSIADTLRRRVKTVARSRARHEIEDLTQDVLLALLDKRGRRLRLWDPERGLPLNRYVELVSRHLVESFLRKRERRVWENDQIDGEGFSQLADKGESPEHIVERKELLGAVLALVEAELTRQGREIFRLLVLDGLSVHDVCAQTGLTQNAVHVWRSRLTDRIDEATRRILRGALADE